MSEEFLIAFFAVLMVLAGMYQWAHNKWWRYERTEDE